MRVYKEWTPVFGVDDMLGFNQSNSSYQSGYLCAVDLQSTALREVRSIEVRHQMDRFTNLSLCGGEEGTPAVIPTLGPEPSGQVSLPGIAFSQGHSPVPMCS